MKPVSKMSRLELAAFIATEFRRRNINVVLSGGSCVSIYSAEKYVSVDLDFVNAGFAKRAAISAGGHALGYVPRIANAPLARLMDAGKQLFARIEGKEWRGDWLRIDMSVHLRDF